MADQRIVVHDSGLWPLWLRLPCLAFGLVSLALATDLLANLLLQAHFLWFLQLVPHPTSVMIAAAAFLLVLGFAFANAWAFRRRLVLVPDHCLILEMDWLGGTLRRTVPLAEVAAVVVKPTRGMVGTSHPRWLVQIRRSDAGLFTLLETLQQDEAEALADRLSCMLGVSSEQV